MPTRRGTCVVCKRAKKGIPSETGALVCKRCRNQYGVKIAPYLEVKNRKQKAGGK